MRFENYEPVWYREDVATYFKRSMSTITTWKNDGTLPEYDVTINNKVCGWHESTLIAHGLPIKRRELAYAA